MLEREFTKVVKQIDAIGSACDYQPADSETWARLQKAHVKQFALLLQMRGTPRDQAKAFAQAYFGTPNGLARLKRQYEQEGHRG